MTATNLRSMSSMLGEPTIVIEANEYLPSRHHLGEGDFMRFVIRDDIYPQPTLTEVFQRQPLVTKGRFAVFLDEPSTLAFSVRFSRREGASSVWFLDVFDTVAEAMASVHSGPRSLVV